MPRWDPEEMSSCVLKGLPSVTLRRKGDWRMRCIVGQVHVVERLRGSELSYELLCSARNQMVAEKFWVC